MNAASSSIPALLVIGAVAIPALVYLLLGLGERILDRAGIHGSGLRPWLWLLFPLAAVGIVLLYPSGQSMLLAFRDRDGHGWVGIANFSWAVGGDMRSILVNNVIWLVVLPLGTAFLALIVAVLFDKVQYERFAMTLIMLPSAVSFTAAAVIWRDNFSFQPGSAEQTGLLNALWTLIPGNTPQPWLQTPILNTLCLIFVAVWSILGVAALILSAAVKNVPEELSEAARIDGAGEWTVFRVITLPSIFPALLVVITTTVIFALKIFDIVYVMTNGNFKSDVIGNRQYYELFGADDLGHASAIAVILLIAALPIVAINIQQFRAEGAE